jgi:hypothetical protein
MSDKPSIKAPTPEQVHDLGELRLCNQDIPLIGMDSLVDEDGNPMFGCYTGYPKPTVCVSMEVANVDMGQFRSAVVHELLHAVSDINGLELSEQTVRALEIAIVGFCKDNEDDARFILFGDVKSKAKKKKK